MRADNARRGTAMIEAVIAIVMLAVAGTGLITLLGQTRHSMRTLRESERAIRAASAQLDRLVLLDRGDLVAREGRSSNDGWSIRIAQIDVALFDVSVAPSDTSAALLSTTVYRPDSSNADR
jgi:Tfp pilus assembly protein PilV